MTPDDSTVDTANRNIFSSTSIPVRTNASSKSAPIPVVSHPEQNVLSNLVQPFDIDEKCATSDDHHNTTDISSDMFEKKLITPSNIYIQLSQDSVDDGGVDDKEESYHLQSADNTLATASHSTYSTPCSGARNEPFFQPNQINIVTPPESNIAPVTTRLTGTSKKCAPSDGHPDCIDLSKDDNDDTMENMGCKKHQ